MTKIVTDNIFPPVPNRQFDWCAFYDGDEERGGYGYGATEEAAIDDLLGKPRVTSGMSNLLAAAKWVINCAPCELGYERAWNNLKAVIAAEEQAK